MDRSGGALTRPTVGKRLCGARSVTCEDRLPASWHFQGHLCSQLPSTDYNNCFEERGWYIKGFALTWKHTRTHKRNLKNMQSGLRKDHSWGIQKSLHGCFLVDKSLSPMGPASPTSVPTGSYSGTLCHCPSIFMLPTMCSPFFPECLFPDSQFSSYRTPILSSQPQFKCHRLWNLSWLHARTPSLLFASPPL